MALFAATFNIGKLEALFVSIQYARTKRKTTAFISAFLIVAGARNVLAVLEL